MFLSVKSCKKDDLIFVAKEIGEDVPTTAKISDLKNIILESDEYKSDPDFVKEILENAVADRKLQEEREFEKEERLQIERLKLNNELEIAKIQAQNQTHTQPTTVINQPITDTNNAKKKFTLPKLQFRQFGDDLRDWLPFWSQFEHIDKDGDIAPENKFQYLVQATVTGSRAREVVESFPPTGENYTKAIDSLKARFGRDDLLVEVYVRELLKLIISVQSNQKLSPMHLYDKLESYLRALETLGVTTDKCASILYPMVESCFEEEFLRAWNRSPNSSAKDAKGRLDNLMLFLKGEVEGEERISLAMSGFGLAKGEDFKTHRKKKYNSEALKIKIPTASMLVASNKAPEEKKPKCIFCDGKHLSPDCFTASNFPLEEKQKIIRDKNCCFACLLPGHSVRKCRKFIKCPICSKRHVTLMCEQLQTLKNPNLKKEEDGRNQPKEEGNSHGINVNLSNLNRNPRVFLQTFKATLLSGDNEKVVRILCDSGSQKSYILRNVAEDMKYPVWRQETLKHSLFGGIYTKDRKHNCYRIKLKRLNGNFTCNFEVLDQDIICENVQPVTEGPWMRELKALGVVLTDTEVSCESIQVLIGADILGKLLTGKREILSSGLVAIETHLGWTLMGKVPEENNGKVNLAATAISLFVNEASITDLWNLEIIGIKDSATKIFKEEEDLKTKENFLKTVAINDEGRYEVALPWKEDHIPLSSHRDLAFKRLQKVTTKLKSNNIYEVYDNVLNEWNELGIIEEVPFEDEDNYGHYLPHRPVIKEEGSTKVRPVFDASAKEKSTPSLNHCLSCGPNLIELIPSLLLRFRELKYGVSADIEKAFLQISVRKSDRDYLRFLWWTDSGQLKVYRHKRVVFGVVSSPFLLGAVLKLHLETLSEDPQYDKKILEKLKQSFYVDNVVTSVNRKEDLYQFIHESKKAMSEGMFNLRAWQYTGDMETSVSSVLGILWNRDEDCLQLNLQNMKPLEQIKVTKREILSISHRIFDPIGISSPVLLLSKLLLQKMWKKGVSWDEEVDEGTKEEFLKWYRDLDILKSLKIPRWFCVSSEEKQDISIHTFCDASQDAYAAAIFIRIKSEEKVDVHLLSAKSRVAPPKCITIPRLELLAALIGARLCATVLDGLSYSNRKDLHLYYWTDSTTVLAWIQNEENWSVFVNNRVKEIRRLSDKSLWKHIPGISNPADLPSRGCNVKQLITCKWWEGPSWLYEDEYSWPTPTSEIPAPEEALLEKRKTAIINLATEKDGKFGERFLYFSSYTRVLRMTVYVLRFCNNIRKGTQKLTGVISCEEIEKAENTLVKIIQSEWPMEIREKYSKTIQFYVENGILRVQTRLVLGEDPESFTRPIVLPDHPILERLILHIHVSLMHAGVLTTLAQLRERFWIPKGRKIVKAVLRRCIQCKKLTSKSVNPDPAPLPPDRIQRVAAFQITGADLAGPLFLRGGVKAWIVLFTCAVYRAIHLELVSSLSTETFMQALRRFWARRGRGTTLYTDNGTNFKGTDNALKSLDWDSIQRECGLLKIKWRFSPPSAPWYGGFWERMVQCVKVLLRKCLGKACVTYEEMLTLLCDCEATVNGRPLTYLSDDPNELKPLTPAHFIQDLKERETIDLDLIDTQHLLKRVRYLHTLRLNLRKRFYKEYLGELIRNNRSASMKKIVSPGDIVLVESTNPNRINWPLAQVIELFPSKDKLYRVARLRVANGEIIRPVQRIYPLELISVDKEQNRTELQLIENRKVYQGTEAMSRPKIGGETVPEEARITRCGRRVMPVKRMNL